MSENQPHDFLDDKESPYRKVKGWENKLGVFKRRVPQAGDLLANTLVEKTAATAGSDRYLNQNPVSRREFLNKGFWAVILTAVGGVIYAEETNLGILRGLFSAYQRTTSEDPQAKEQELESREIQELLILREANNGGVKSFTKDVATIAARSRNFDGQPVNFTNRSTWTSSELETYFRALDRLTNELQTQDGRGKIRSYINKAQTQYAGEYLGYVDRFEKYLTNNNLPVNVDQATLRNYFTASVDKDGLGYPGDQAALLFDTLDGYRRSSISLDIKTRINQFNQSSGLDLRIP